MFCPKCGKKLKGTPKFCTYCGTLLMEEVARKPFEKTLGIPAKIGIGVTVICLAAGSAMFGYHMAHRRNSAHAVVAAIKNPETIEEKKQMETTTEAMSATEEISQTEEIAAVSTENPEDVRIKETNQQAVAAYRKYLSDRMYLPDNPEPGEEGRIGEFCLVDLNQDGIFELFADNLNTESCAAGEHVDFVYYYGNAIKKEVLLPFLIYDPENSKIISWYSKQGYIVETYQYSGNDLVELGHWDLTDDPWLMTENELLETIDDTIRVSGNNNGYKGNFVLLNEENLRQYLSSDGIATGNGKSQRLNEDILSPLKNSWYSYKKDMDEETGGME